MKKEEVTLESLALTISKQFEAIGQQFQAINQRLDAIERRLDRIETTQAEHGRKLDLLLDGGVDMSTRHAESDDQLGHRVEVLEHAFLKHLAAVS